MGEVFAGRYELADPIGRGGVGAVWRAWDHRRRRYVAAKVLRQRDAHSLLRFVREQGLRIDHPHVLAPASWAADDDKVLFTMDLVAGGSLVHLVNDYGPLPPAFVCTLLDQLLSGLAAVHADDVVHRDIKPANVLLEATGTGRPRLRLSDFGIAMRLGEPRLTETNLVVGTPGYLAPEQLLGAEPDFPADLFAVGLVALYLLQGAKPDAGALVRYFEEHGTPGAPKGIPEPVWGVVASLLQPDPARRFRTATGARKALADAAELLPEPGPDDELVEIFDQLGPLPPGFGPAGPLRQASGVALDLVPGRKTTPDTGGVTGVGTGTDPGRRPGTAPGTGGVTGDGTGTDSARRPGTAPGTGGVTGDSTDTGSGGHSGTGAVPGARADGGGGVSAGTPGARADASAGMSAGTSGSLVTGSGTPAHGSGEPTHTGSLSDTGSFRLPPPQQPPAPDPVPAPHPHTFPPPPAPVPMPTRAPGPLPPPPLDATTDTAAYTARDPRATAEAPPVSPARPVSQPRHRRARRAAPRPGPPARAVLVILLLALACYAVGFWALTRY
ncbi:serine/threonine-protein kinase [Streptomyces sp. NPDC017082]|uniref:serine/threonine-protein kinase n=1 Tax=Streptomyces sp. NPDC017082 TaxID=3364974 RepID=UPI00379095AE